MSDGYVFRETLNGLAFVGDFDGLYAAEDDPWQQSGQGGPMGRYYLFSRRRVIRALREHKAQGAGLEIGCGHGHLTAMIDALPCVSCLGVDISAKALAKARSLYPGVAFKQGDITKPLKRKRKPEYGFVILAQCWWYVLSNVGQAVDNCLAELKPGGLFIVTQAFLKEQRWGVHIAKGFEGALDLLMDHYGDHLVLIEARYDDGPDMVHHDGLMVFRKC